MTERFDGNASPVRRSANVPLERARVASRLRRALRAPVVEHPDLAPLRARDLDRAVNGLRRRRPDLSAGEPIWAWQKWTLVLLLPALAGLVLLAPDKTVFVLAAVLAVPFFCIVLLRSAALWQAALARPPEPGILVGPAPSTLPRYSLLVPLYDETDIVPDLIAALSAIDYPADALEILLILEEEDRATRAVLDEQSLPPHMTTVIVPKGEPRTKPRALNYAFPRTTGDLIVVYDAEDLPEPDQLRRAVAMLSGAPGLGCTQARLNVLNADENWLTRQFAIEYTVLFDCLLPTLEALRLPVPLGGTSNHFSRTALEEVGGWDPFNVTEDADLGIRLARSGWAVKVLGSTTWEEAPPNLGAWLKQRTRWLKGWMQTYLVHMRRPLRTARDLGWLRFAGLQVLMGGLILSALVHPLFYAATAAELAFGPLSTLGNDALSRTVKVIAALNLVLGYVVGVALGCVAVAGRGRPGLAVTALSMPLYWLLISLAAYRALYQLAAAPYRWEKTQHRPRAAFTGPGAG